jgi:hypothetical protein
MDRDAHEKAVTAWIGDEDPQRWGIGKDRALDPMALGRALYAVSELGLWPDSVDSVGVDQAVMCWRIIERLRATAEFPEELAM